MNKTIKSIAYAFASRDLNIYFPDGEDNCFMIEKCICSNCGQYWHTSLNECYFCGDINHYLFTCETCGKKHSITNNSRKCTCGNKLFYYCQNPNCISNLNDEIKSMTEKEDGVFSRNSSFSVSLNHCVTCGSKVNIYKTYRIYILFENQVEKDYIKEKLLANDLLIHKINNANYKVYYINEKSIEENFIARSIDEVIDYFYKIN